MNGFGIDVAGHLAIPIQSRKTQHARLVRRLRMPQSDPGKGHLLDSPNDSLTERPFSSGDMHRNSSTGSRSASSDVSDASKAVLRIGAIIAPRP